MISEIVFSEYHYILSLERPFLADLHAVIALEI